MNDFFVLASMLQGSKLLLTAIHLIVQTLTSISFGKVEIIRIRTYQYCYISSISLESEQHEAFSFSPNLRPGSPKICKYTYKVASTHRSHSPSICQIKDSDVIYITFVLPLQCSRNASSNAPLSVTDSSNFPIAVAHQYLHSVSDRVRHHTRQSFVFLHSFEESCKSVRQIFIDAPPQKEASILISTFF